MQVDHRRIFIGRVYLSRYRALSRRVRIRCDIAAFNPTCVRKGNLGAVKKKRHSPDPARRARPCIPPTLFSNNQYETFNVIAQWIKRGTRFYFSLIPRQVGRNAATYFFLFFSQRLKHLSHVHVIGYKNIIVSINKYMQEMYVKISRYREMSIGIIFR